jgi:hypothetical protein
MNDLVDQRVLNKELINEYVVEWLKSFKERTPLFEMNKGTLFPIPHPKDGRFVRSKELSHKIDQIRQIFLKRFQNNSPISNGIGVCYLIYQFTMGAFDFFLFLVK